MLINDLTKNNVCTDLICLMEKSPFLLTWDFCLETPAITVVDVNDSASKQEAENKGYPVVVYENNVFYFPNKFQIPAKKRELLKTKMFHLAKKFYQLPNEIVSKNINIHLINDWYEEDVERKLYPAFSLSLLINSYIFGGALRANWFLHCGSLRALEVLINRHCEDLPISVILRDDLIYIKPKETDNQVFDLYFYEQDFQTICEVSENIQKLTKVA